MGPWWLLRTALREVMHFNGAFRISEQKEGRGAGGNNSSDRIGLSAGCGLRLLEARRSRATLFAHIFLSAKRRGGGSESRRGTPPDCAGKTRRGSNSRVEAQGWANQRGFHFTVKVPIRLVLGSTSNLRVIWGLVWVFKGNAVPISLIINKYHGRRQNLIERHWLQLFLLWDEFNMQNMYTFQ